MANKGVALDVTTFISAEDYILSFLRNTSPIDPFARQSYVELVQTCLLREDVYVLHPSLWNARDVDYGDRPILLSALFDEGVVRPARLSTLEIARASENEVEVAEHLHESGARLLLNYVDNMLLMDESTASLSKKLKGWSEFQLKNVRNVTNHMRRVDTSDGIEADDIGDWIRATATSARGILRPLAVNGEESYLLSTLTRSLKYSGRAECCALSYAPHPMRRDFSVSFDFDAEGASNDDVFDIVGALRGLRDAIANERLRYRTELLEIELPLLGGRLWSPDDMEGKSESDWLRFVAERIAEYRSRTGELRDAVENTVRAEDKIALARDLEEVKFGLLERLGLVDVEASRIETDLTKGVAAIVESVPGVPKVSTFLLGARALGRRMRYAGNPYQKFVYREFLDAWKRTSSQA